MGLTDASGTIINRYQYDAFGNTVEAVEKVQNRFRYAGEQYDQVTGQYYLRARFYNPVVGRFTQEDTYRGDGLNLYSYVHNNPVNYYDPSGYSTCGSKTNPYDSDLSSRGYKPKPGERSMTREQWKAQKSGYKSGTRMADGQLLRKKTNTNGTNNITEWRRSISPDDIKAERIKFLGDDAVKVDAGTWRSLDGTRQFRSVPSDYLGKHSIGNPPVPNTPHVHYEFLAPPNPGGSNLRVIKNVHVPIG